MCSVRTRGGARNWSESTKSVWKPNRTRKRSTPVLAPGSDARFKLLPLHERSAVLLCCQNGLSHDEASRVLDIPLGTVKTNVLRGREKLKKTLAAWGTK